MTNGKFVAYYRVSTARQGQSGLGLEAQKEAVRVYLNGGRWKLVGEFKEIESGKRNDRPALTEALAMCRIHGAQLVVAKLDRLARNVAFTATLMESGIEFTAVDFPQANRLTVHLMAAFAEFEATQISARTKAALGAAKARGVVLGGNRGNIAREASRGARASAVVRGEAASKRAHDRLPAIRHAQSQGATTLREIAALLNQAGIPTARGGEWSAIQVQRVLAYS